MNTAAHRLEQDGGRRLMSRAHGFWSLGSLFGALMGAGFASLGFSLQMHFLLAMPTIGFISWLFARKIPYQRVAVDADASLPRPSVFKLPNRGLILLCVMPIGIMLVEGAFIDWSALFVRTVLNGGAEAAGLIYASFSLVMAAARLSGDWLVDTYGPVKVAKVSSVAATLGILVFSLAPTVTFAFIGALFSGLGVAVFYPLTMSAAATRPGNSEDNVAAMSLFAFTSFMIAPPALGILIDHAGMRTALIVLAPLAAYSYLLSHELTKGHPTNE